MNDFSILTPYWSGAEMMRIHLESFRRFHPSAPFLVSKRGGGELEMEGYRREFGIEYWIEDASWLDATIGLLRRCKTKWACVADHDTVLLGSLSPLLASLSGGECDLVGMEEVVREPPGSDWAINEPDCRGWFRFAPKRVACTFIIFDLQKLVERWGLRGVLGGRAPGSLHEEPDYGISERLQRHRYLLPFHTRRYGAGTLLMDGERQVVWHQGGGSYRFRYAGPDPDVLVPDPESFVARLRSAESAFLSDYPDPDFSELFPAWGAGIDIEAERKVADQMYGTRTARLARRLREWRTSGLRRMVGRARERFLRWKELRRR